MPAPDPAAPGDAAPAVAPPSGRSARGELTRERILDAARRTFATAGWTRARVEDVCRTAGVGHGTFYAYYANKSAVLEALVRRHAAALTTVLDAEWTSGDLRADVRRVIAGFVERSDGDADVRDVWLAAAPAEPGLTDLVAEVRGQFVDRIRRNLAAARDAGHARADLDVDIAALALAAMVEQSVARTPRDDADGDRERLVEGLTDLWVHAVYRS